jgi:hypothetical protein
MSNTHWVVDVEVGAEQAQEYAETAKQWLLQEGIVLPLPEPTDVFPVDSRCYPKHLLAPGPRASIGASPMVLIQFSADLKSSQANGSLTPAAVVLAI